MHYLWPIHTNGVFLVAPSFKPNPFIFPVFYLAILAIGVWSLFLETALIYETVINTYVYFYLNNMNCWVYKFLSEL